MNLSGCTQQINTPGRSFILATGSVFISFPFHRIADLPWQIRPYNNDAAFSCSSPAISARFSSQKSVMTFFTISSSASRFPFLYVITFLLYLHPASLNDLSWPSAGAGICPLKTPCGTLPYIFCTFWTSSLPPLHFRMLSSSLCISHPAWYPP